MAFKGIGASIALTAALAVTGSCALVGCSEQPAETPAVQEETITTVGSESEGCLAMVFENASGQDIVSIAVMPNGVEGAGFSENMLGAAPWAANEKIRLCCDTYEVAADADSAQADIKLDPAYDVQIGFADGTSAVLHGVTFKEAESVSVCVDGESGLGYLVYMLDGAEATTLEAETALKAQEEAAAQAAAEAEAAAAEAAAAAQAAPSYSYDYSASGSGSSGSSGSGSSGSSGSSQSEDACMGDDLLLR